MPRRPRLHVPDGIYHVILRGNNQQVIFVDEWDFQRLEKLIAEGCERYGTRVHAFCWMTNHIHLAAQVGTIPLGRLMRWLGSQYARGFNRRYNRRGHVFERRHWAKFVDDDAYILSLARYIHLNPVGAGIVVKPEEYRWSSHRAYLGEDLVPWMTTSLILSIFGEDEPRSRAQFAQFVADPPNPDCEWTADTDTKPNRHQPENPPSSDPDAASCTLAPLESLIEQHCLHLEISPEELVSSSRARQFAKARAVIARDAIEKDIATLAEISRRFGRSESVVLRTMSHYQNNQGAWTP